MKNLFLVLVFLILVSIFPISNINAANTKAMDFLLAPNSFINLDIGLIKLQAWWAAVYNPKNPYIYMENGYYSQDYKKIVVLFSIDLKNPRFLKLKKKEKEKDMMKQLRSDVIDEMKLIFPDLKTEWKDIIRIEIMNDDTNKVIAIADGDNIKFN